MVRRLVTSSYCRQRALHRTWAAAPSPQGAASALLILLLGAACAREAPYFEILQEPSAGPIAAGQTLEFPLTAAQGDRLLLEAEQNNLDFGLTLIDPSGREVVSVDLPTERVGVERIFHAATQEGRYLLKLQARGHGGVSGAYSISYGRAARSLSTALENGYEALTEGARLFAASDYQAAADAFTASSRSFARASRPDLVAQADLALARIAYQHLLDWNAAAAAAARAAQQFQPTDVAHYAYAISLQAKALNESARSGQRDEAAFAGADLDRARALLLEALGIYTKSGAEFAVARTHTSLGMNDLYRDKFAEAVHSFERAAAILRRLQERQGELMALQDIAAVQALRGNYRQAAEALEPLVAEMSPERDGPAYADVCANSAFALAQIGDTTLALSRYASALDVQRRHHDVGGQARSLQGVANIHWRLGEKERALEMFRAALPLREAASDRRGAIITLVSIGNLERELGRIKEARRFHERAMALVEEGASATDRLRVHVALAGDHNAAGDPRQALRSLSSALAPEAAPPLHARALMERATAHAALGELRAASADLEAAIALQEELGAVFEQSIARVSLARVHERRQQPQKAVAELDAALAMFESLRSRAAGPELRASFLAARHEAYQRRVALALGSGAATATTEALLIAERFHARALLDELARDGSAQWTDASALELVRLYEQLDGQQLRLQALMAQGVARDDGRLAGLKADMHLSRARIASVRARTPAVEHGSARGVEDAAALANLRAQLAPDDAILQYFMAADRSWLWIVSREDVRVVQLPGEQAITRAAREFLREIATPATTQTPALRSAARELARLVLWPAALGSAERRLMIIGDGALSGAPFAALPQRDGAAADLLIDAAEIIATPSLSTLSMLMKREAAAPKQAWRIAIVADPVFSQSDSRLPPALRRLGGGVAEAAPPRLPATLEEAEAIAGLLPAGQVSMFVGHAATPAFIAALRAQRHTALHIASHVRVDRASPGLTSILLSGVNERGERIDGSLRAYQIAGSSAWPGVVVLSACDSSVGREFRGEGAFGLSRAFLQGGARSVVAAGWPVADAATLALMKAFYERMMGGGEPPSQALRLAQLQLRRETRWSHPHFWAAFSAYGGASEATVELTHRLPE